jgi:hypothetical protein
MRAHYGVVALLTFAACVQQPGEATESASSALGVVPASEIAQWKRVGSTTLPSPRVGQAVALDEVQGVLVMFGGLSETPSTGQTALRDIWEWSQTAGTWKLRTPTGSAPDARSGAAMAYDSTRKKFVMFGGRAGSGYDLQDAWEWDPATGEWADKTGGGASPSARSQAGMVFDSKNNKILLFGGGRSELGGDPMNITLAYGDTWEYDGTRWTQRTTTVAPSARSGFGLAYSTGSSKAYLFGGMEVTTYNAPGTPKQDIWEYDGGTGTWTERTAAGSKPSPRFGHGMAMDSANGLAAVFGGFDISTSGSKNDVWYWNVTSGTWQGQEAAAGAPWPGQRRWASLIMSGTGARAFLVAGLVSGAGGGTDAGVPFPSNGYGGASREVWELTLSGTTWANRSAPNDNPGARQSHTMTADPTTGKVYLFGGTDSTGATRNDLWEWDGGKWVECGGDIAPSVRADSAMSYDPVRKSLILFGGNSMGYYTGWDMQLGDTWEWSIATRKWTQLTPATSPQSRSRHAMVTDTTRGKVLLYGGQSSMPIIYPPDGGVAIPEYQIWEWDGATANWTDRSPVILVQYPNQSSPPAVVYDEARKKLAIFGFAYYGEANASYWEWDPDSGAFSARVITDLLNISEASVVYDSIRRRTVAVGAPMNGMVSSPPVTTCELESVAPNWYVRSITESPSSRWATAMAFDRLRDVVVMYGGADLWMGMSMDDTWEYRVKSWGNGAGCGAEFAAQCASGFCVDGVCCDSASCTGACKSCNVPGKEGTCVLATPGMQVPGSCSGDQACDATGSCKTSNGKPCTSAGMCASGSCVDGVCCDTACAGTCASCNQKGKVGTCTPYVAGTDPQGECSQGTPPCQSTCDGVGACFYPAGMACGNCGYCDGSGWCQEQWYCSTDMGRDAGTGTTVIPWRDGGPLTWTVTASTGTATLTASVTTGTATATGSVATTGSRTSLATATSTLSRSTSTATGTGTFATAPTTGTLTTIPTGTGTSTPTATSAGTASTGNVTSRATALPTATQTGSGTGTSKNGTATGSVTTNTATTSTTNTKTQPSPDGGAGDAGATKLGKGGCSCQLGARPVGGFPGASVLVLLGMLPFLCRSTRKRTRR